MPAPVAAMAVLPVAPDATQSLFVNATSDSSVGDSGDGAFQSLPPLAPNTPTSIMYFVTLMAPGMDNAPLADRRLDRQYSHRHGNILLPSHGHPGSPDGPVRSFLITENVRVRFYGPSPSFFRRRAVLIAPLDVRWVGGPGYKFNLYWNNRRQRETVRGESHQG